MACQFVAYLLFALAGIGVEVFFCLLAFVVLGLRCGLRESCGFEFFYTLQLVGSQALTFGLIALYGDELLGIYLLATTEGIGATIGYLNARVGSVCQQQQLRGRIV